MQITIDTNNLSDMDIAMLAFLADQGETVEDDDIPEPEPTPAKAEKAAKKAAAAKPEPTPEPEEEEEDLVGGEGPTMSDAIAAATELVSSGSAAKVKAALAEIGVKRVSELEEKDIATFLAELAKDE